MGGISPDNRGVAQVKSSRVDAEPCGVLLEPEISIETLSRAEKTVKLISVLPSDAACIATILHNLGFDSLCSVPAFSLKRDTVVPIYAAIVCHRHLWSHSHMDLVSKLTADRVIVFSDCPDERTAIDFLTNGARHFFDIQESQYLLHARLYAALRHHQSSLSSTLIAGDIHLDRQRGLATRGGHPVKLTPKEFAFACQMVSKVGQVVCNEELMTSIWSLPANMDTRRIDSAASLVRKKLRLVCSEGWELKRIRCVGYQLIRKSDNFL